MVDFGQVGHPDAIEDMQHLRAMLRVVEHDVIEDPGSAGRGRPEIGPGGGGHRSGLPTARRVLRAVGGWTDAGLAMDDGGTQKARAWATSVSNRMGIPSEMAEPGSRWT